MTMSWSDLPADLVAAIADRITDHADFSCFLSVCPSWRSASAVHAARRRLPLLLLPAEYQLRVDRHLWSLADDSIAEIPLPAALGFFLFASPRGWTLAVDHYFSVAVLHPFTGASVGLPELPPSFRGDIIVRRDMVWDRSPHGAVMIARRTKKPCSSAAFFCRPGDESWIPVECSEELDRVSSITYCDGAFYLFDGETRRTVGVDSESFAVTAVIEPPVTRIRPDERLLPWSWYKVESTLVVSSADDFLVIVLTRKLEGCSGGSGQEASVEAFRWDRRSWAGVDDIGGRAVFVDSFRGFCVEANGVNGVRRNCVYVADASPDGSCAVSVLDLAGGTTMERLSLGNLGKHRCGRFWQRPSWSMPNLH